MGAAGTTQSLLDKTLGHFRVVAEIGRGGMGVVFIADDAKLGRSVALKVLREEVSGDAGRRVRFLREARAAAAVNHPNIAAIYEAGESEDGAYLAMELVEGKPLRALLDGSPLGIDAILTIARGVAAALAKAHDKGVIHRDLKPENILVTPEGQPKVVDFGLAKIQENDALVSGDAETIAQVSREGAFVGTPAYASPEQARGLAVDHRTDLFSFGVVLYEIATGERPFRGATEMDVLAKLMTEAARPPRGLRAEVPEWLERVILKCLEKAPAARYPSAHELVRDLAGETAPRAANPVVSSASAPDRRSELILLERVREFWIDGVLRHATKDEALLEIVKDERLAAVDRGFELAAPRLDEDETPIDENTTILDYFDRRGAALLILGEPGSGKTVTLLELTRALVERADRDAAATIPVVLSLATWRDAKLPIATWIVDQLRESYRIPEKVGRAWVESDRLTLLLDGLDEVTPSLVGDATTMLNRFRDEHGFVPIAVACRRTDYEALTTKLKLGAAIQLRALSDGQIDGYLSRAGERLTPLAAALASDAELRELAHSPLMLNIMSLSYSTHSPDSDPPGQVLRPATDRRSALFDRYVEKMLARREGRLFLSPERTKQTLAWLARNMKSESETVFALEELQPASLPAGRPRLFYFAVTRLLVAVLFASVIKVNGVGEDFRISLILAIFLPLAVLDYRLGAKPRQGPQSLGRRALDVVSLLAAMAQTLTIAFTIALARMSHEMPTAMDILRGAGFGLLLGAFFAIPLAWRRGRLARGRDVRTVESFRIRPRRFAIGALLLALVPALAVWIPFRDAPRSSVTLYDTETPLAGPSPGPFVAAREAADIGATSAVFSHDGRRAYLGHASDEPLTIFDVATGKRFDAGLLGKISVDPTGRFVAASSAADIVIANAETLQIVRVLEFPSDVPRSGVDDVLFSSDGLLLASGERASLLFDPKTGTVLHRFDGYAAFASDKDHVILNTLVGDVLVAKRDGSELRSLAFIGRTSQDNVTHRADVDPSGRYLVATKDECLYRVASSDPGDLVRLPLPGCESAPPAKDGARPARLWFSTDGALVILARHDETLFLDRDFKMIARVAGAADDVAISDDGRRVLLTADCRLVLYRGSDGGLIANLETAGKDAPWASRGARMNGSGTKVVSFSSAPPASGVAAILAIAGLLVAFVISGEIGVVRLKTRVNEGIHRTLKRALTIAVAIPVFVAAASYSASALTAHAATRSDAVTSITLGLFFGVAFGLGFGGLDLVYHYVLRLLLAARGELPLRAAPFLDSAVQLIVLRRVGGGYMFIHRLVLEHFARKPERREGG